MFEREVMISSLKKQSEDLKKLLGEMEAKPRHGWQDMQYFRETLKRIESALRRMRRAEEEDRPYMLIGAGKYCSAQFPMREMS